MTATAPSWLGSKDEMKGRFWLLVAVVLFIVASARFASLGDTLGASVFGVVALVFAIRMVIEIRRRKRNLGG
jgi:Flp pilus assembly protein TadB